MAGICGVIGVEDQELIRKMASLMAHRGEAIEVFANNGVAIALIYRSDEPRLYDDGLVSIALDQDIYAIGNNLIDNYSAIHDYLVSGISYKDAIKGLRGGFALSIVEKGKSSKKLTLARDIYGTRSMYYLKTDHAVFFASELKCFLAIDELKHEINPNALNYYLTCGFSPNRDTFLKHVYRVLPGEIVEFEDENFSYAKYWRPRLAEQEPLDLNNWSEHAWENLLGTTKAVLPPKEHKVGIALSGGLDSSLVAAMLRHADKQLNIVGLSLNYGDNDTTELMMAEKVAKYLDIDFHAIEVNPEQVVHELGKSQWIYDEPLIKFPFIPTYHLFNAAKDHVKTLFSGDGGDEQFIGYRNDYWEDPLAVKLFSRSGFFKRPLLRIGENVTRPLARLTGSRILSLGTEFFTRDYASHSHQEYRIASRVFQPYFGEEELPKLIRDYSFQGVTDTIVESINTSQSYNTAEKISHAMLTNGLPNDLLRLEKSAVSTGMKWRAPLLDPKLTNFMLSVPMPLRYQNNTTKYFIRYLCTKYGLLPDEIVNTRAKRGLTAPIYQWLTKSPTREYFSNLMESGSDLLDMDYVSKVWPPRTYTETLKSWCLVGILVWCETFSNEIREGIAMKTRGNESKAKNGGQR